MSQVGGLADVVTGLGRALQRAGHLVEVVLPKYDAMDYSVVIRATRVIWDPSDHVFSIKDE